MKNEVESGVYIDLDKFEYIYAINDHMDVVVRISSKHK